MEKLYKKLGWDYKLISDVLFFQEGPGVRKTQYTHNGIKLLNVTNILDGYLDLSLTDRYISEEEAYGKYKHFLVDSGDLIIACSGIQLDYFDEKIAFAKDENLPLCMNTSTMRFKVKNENELDIRYVYYFLKSNLFKQQLSRQITGSAQLNFGPSHIKKMFIPIPEINYQKYVVEILDIIKNLIQTRHDQIQALDDLLESVFNESLNENDNLVKIKDYVKVNPAKSEVKDLDPDTIISFVPMEDVSEKGELNLSKTKTIEESYKGFTYFKNDDVVVAKITPCFENGKGTLMKNLVNGIGFGTTEFHVLRIKDKNVLNPVWLNYLTRTRYFRELGEIRMFGSAGQKRVGKDFVENFKFNLPPIEKQNQFAAFVEKIEKQKQILNDSLRELVDLFDSLMQDAFDGSMTM